MRCLVVAALAVVLAMPRIASADAALPKVRAHAVAVLDARTGAEIFAKDADQVRAIASTTKIFVAMVVRKKGLNLDAWTKIERSDVRAAIGGGRTRLDINESFQNRDLLRAMLIASDNRAPTALGRAVGLDSRGLIAEMNKLAKRLHLVRTRFTDASGLRGNVSTAREMAIALKAALDDEVLRKIMGDTFESVVSKDRSAKIGYVTTNLPLVLAKYDVIGGKTGYTTPAGYCFITAARFAGREVVVAILGARTKHARFEDFNRVAAWLDRGAPGSKIALSRPAKGKGVARPKLDVDVRGRVAAP